MAGPTPARSASTSAARASRPSSSIPTGKRLTERLRVDTPRPATPKAVIKAILGLAKQQGAFDRISVGFPGVVRRGVVETAHNLHPTGSA